MGDIKDSKKTHSWLCQILGLEAVLTHSASWSSAPSCACAWGRLSVAGRSSRCVTPVGGCDRSESAHIMSKPARNPWFHLDTIVFEKCFQEKWMFKCMCFRHTDSCNFHGCMSPINLTKVHPAAAASFSVPRSSTTVSLPLAFLGQTHLIDLETPWPWEVSPFQWALSLQVFSVIISWPLTCESVWLRGIGTLLPGDLCIVSSGSREKWCSLVNLWSFKNPI